MAAIRGSGRFATKVAPTGFILATVACLLQPSACALRPEWQSLASEGGLQSRWIDTGAFGHRVLANDQPGEVLRIYVEGDGTPWIRETRVSLDPTPTNPVMLSLMHDETRPAAYLGRPCYFGSATDARCDERLWTFDRYGTQVVASMCKAANELARERGASSVELFGYSGGAAIVIGMKHCTENLVALTTIAGNLDPDAWTVFHDYTPLGDLSPLQTTNQVNDAVPETHWQCRDDENIPPGITDAFFLTRKNATRHLVTECSHATGWHHYWSQIAATRANE